MGAKIASFLTVKGLNALEKSFPEVDAIAEVFTGGVAVFALMVC